MGTYEYHKPTYGFCPTPQAINGGPLPGINIVNGNAYHPAPHVWNNTANLKGVRDLSELQTQPVLGMNNGYRMAFPITVDRFSKVRLIPRNVTLEGKTMALPTVDFRFCGDPGGFRPPHRAPC